MENTENHKKPPSNLKFIIEAIVTINEGKENSGVIKCPKCEGDLKFTKAKSNGHIWAQCKTENCLKWMQ